MESELSEKSCAVKARRQFKSHPRGFSLIEVLLAMMVVSVFAACLGPVLQQAAGARGTAEREMQAVGLARMRLEEWVSELKGPGEAFWLRGGRWRNRADAPAEDTLLPSFRVARRLERDEAEGLALLTVTVLYEDVGLTRERSLTTLVTPRE